MYNSTMSCNLESNILAAVTNGAWFVWVWILDSSARAVDGEFYCLAVRLTSAVKG